MKQLLVSYWFPPSNAIGAVRVGKFAAFMRAAGHDVRVLCGPEIPPLTLPLEIPPEHVLRPPRANRNEAASPPPRSTVGHTLRRLLPLRVESALRDHYRALRAIPDTRIGWLAPATDAGRAALRSWRPDLILASAPPFTGLFVARRLARESGVPWIAELRDPWADDPYSDDPAWRQRLDRLLERRTLRTASGLVAVSPSVTRDLAARYAVPVTTVLNGYSPEDLVVPPPRAPSETLTIVYTGSIYARFRDPSPLFAALARLGALRERIDVRFYGPDETQIRPLAERYHVADRVSVRPAVSYRESLQLQAAADILLLLQHDHPSHAGNIPAKLFEYLGALRPILLLGYAGGIVADMIRTRDAGIVATDPDQIAAHLRQWLAALPAGLPRLPVSARQGLSRAEQFAAYEAFLTGHDWSAR